MIDQGRESGPGWRKSYMMDGEGLLKGMQVNPFEPCLFQETLPIDSYPPFILWQHAAGNNQHTQMKWIFELINLVFQQHNGEEDEGENSFSAHHHAYFPPLFDPNGN